MKATLIVIQNDADHAQAKALVEKLMRSDNPGDRARMMAQARLIEAYERARWPRRAPMLRLRRRGARVEGSNPPSGGSAGMSAGRSETGPYAEDRNPSDSPLRGGPVMTGIEWSDLYGTPRRQSQAASVRLMTATARAIAA
jgi:hypothetical protein